MTELCTSSQGISEYFGHGWTVAAVGGTAIIAFAAYVGEVAGIAGAGTIVGIPVIVTVILVIIAHTIVVATGKYKRIEIFLVAIGFILFLFVALDFFVFPHHKSLRCHSSL